MPKTKSSNKDFAWTPNLAYAVGLIATDGSLSKDERHIAMRSCDIQLLETFRNCLNLSNKISETFNNGWAKKRVYRIQFGDVQLYRWLFKIGLTPNKTHTIGKLKIPDEYFRDFLRGHLDGDGSIRTYTDHYNTHKNPKYVYTRLYTQFASASKQHINWLRRKISGLLSIKGYLREYKLKSSNQDKSFWQLRFAKNDSVKLVSWIYYDCNIPCLERKRRIAEPFI